MSKPPSSIPSGAPALWQQLGATAQALQAVRAGHSSSTALAAVPASLRPGVQALLFQVLRQLGRAQALRQQLAPRTPPPALDALLCTALALAWDEASAPYAPFTLVNQAVQAHRALLLQNGVSVELCDLDFVVYTDRKWVCFLLGQLLQNAARYRRARPVIILSARRQEKRVELTVSDNGMGIPAHELPRVFDRGFTGSNGRLRGGSTGMGLYLAKKLADALEISLAIRSEEGVGTQVLLTFPAQEKLTKL